MSNFYQSENFTEKAQTPTADGGQVEPLYWKVFNGVTRVVLTLNGCSQEEIDELQAKREENCKFDTWRYEAKAPRIPAASAKSVPTDLDKAIDYWTPAKPQSYLRPMSIANAGAFGVGSVVSGYSSVSFLEATSSSRSNVLEHPSTSISVLSPLAGSGSKVDSSGQGLRKLDVGNSHSSAASELVSAKGWQEYKAERAQKESRIEAAIDKKIEKDQSLTVFGKQAVKRLGHCIVEQDSAGISAITKSLTSEQLKSVVRHLQEDLKDFGVVLKAEQRPVANGQVRTCLTLCYDHELPKTYSSSSGN